MKYVKLEDVLKFCPQNNDIVGYKPSYLREKILELPIYDIPEEESDTE
jgi:hypothetical protein